MKIGDLVIGSSNVFVIAEIGNNHNGSIKLALDMVDSAVDAGVDCVKFQMRNMSSVYRKKSLAKQGEDLGTEYVLDLLDRFQLSQDEHEQIANTVRTRAFCTCVRPGTQTVYRPWKR